MEAYQGSTLLAKLQEKQRQHLPLRLVFMDIDSTWTGFPTDQRTVRNLLESLGYAIAAVTNRTSEMCMSWKEREKSSPQVQSRPPAKFRLSSSPSYQIVDPAQVSELAGLLDPDIIASTFGTELFLKQVSGGYQADNTYLKRLPTSPESWHTEVQQLLGKCADQGVQFNVYHPLDVTPTPLRIEAVAKSHQQRDRLFATLTQLSKPSSLHITYDNLTVIVTPAQASKEDAADHVVNLMTQLLSVPPKDLHILFAGDSVADFSMGFLSGAGTQATFIIPGGAALTEELESGKLKKARQQMTKTKNDATLPTGVYWFPKGSRTIVIGDEAFPGTTGPETLIAYLSQPT